MEEEWRDIIGYEGLYQVSNLGRIKSLYKKVICKNGFRSCKEKILKNNSYGDYNRIQIGKKSKHFLVHRLVAKAFIPNPENKPCVNHINGIKTDNRKENLEWSTYSENTIHAYDVLKCNRYANSKENYKRGSDQCFSKLKDYEVKEIRRKYSKGMGIILSKEYNVSQTTILNIVNNKIWVHI